MRGEHMTIDDLRAEAETLVLPAFTETDALRLGAALVATAQDRNLPVVISVRAAHRTYFHAALPGSAANNDHWARRKGNTALMFGTSSLLQRLLHEKTGRTLAVSGLPDADYALSGGAVPVCVQGAGMVAVATVSGLPDTEDHALVVSAIRAMIG
jgi:uncharacterized protein (UPF0303 family)